MAWAVIFGFSDVDRSSVLLGGAHLLYLRFHSELGSSGVPTTARPASSFLSLEDRG